MAKQAGAEIWFSDECGVRSDYHTGTTWGRKGTTPIVKSTGARFRFNLISAINSLGQMRFMLTDKNVNNGVYAEFLRRLLVGASSPSSASGSRSTAQHLHIGLWGLILTH